MTDDAITSNDDLPPCPPILLGIRAALGQSLLEEILSSKILLIGSGGIGCELLKNLALSGFRHVEVVDLDTIDVSNLNRQFLFRSVHVGMPKCVVASEAALRMVPPPPPPPSPPPTPTTRSSQAAAYLPHHGNVFDNSRFNVPFFQKFALVLNALDNVAARRRVNRLCLASDVPLIEAGTAGYLGQVTVIDRRSGTECYECQPKPTQKVYPICTIRSTPSQPVHCVVWAKELYRLCFGPKVEDSMLYEDEEGLRERREGDDDGDGDGDEKKDDDGRMTTTTGDEGSADVAAGRAGGGGSSAYMGAMTDLRSLLGVDPASSPGSSSSSSSSTSPTPYDVASAVRSKAREVISALFVTEIEKQIGMGTYRTADRAPEPLSSSDVDACRDVAPSPTMRDGCAPTDVWSVRECVAEIASCLVEVAENAIAQDPTFPLPEFDKDDDVAMRFVTAASNLRSYVFGIEPIQSMYDAKGMAGNIIPAIATTNAIVAGLQVLQVFHVLRAQLDVKKNGGEGGRLKECCRYIYCLRDKTRKGYLLQPTTLPDPNPECFVCRNAIVSLALNTNEWTLDMLLKRVVKKELGFAEPTVMIGEDIVYEEGEDIDPSEYAANLAKKMVDLPGGGAGHGSVLRIEDFTQDLKVEVSVSHRDCWVDVDEEKGGEAKEDGRAEMEKFEIGGKKLVAATSASSDSMKGDSVSAESDGFRAASANEGEDVLLVEENYVPRGVNEDSKMPAQTSSEHGNGSKEQLKKRAFADQAENGAKKAKFNVEDAKKPDLSEVMS